MTSRSFLLLLVISSRQRLPQRPSKGGNMAKYYAWSTFQLEKNEWGMVTKTLSPGEEVTKVKLNVSDEEWDSLIETGAVSEEKYPDTAPGQSPAEFYAQEEARSAVEELALTFAPPEPEPEPPATTTTTTTK